MSGKSDTFRSIGTADSGSAKGCLAAVFAVAGIAAVIVFAFIMGLSTSGFECSGGMIGEGCSAPNKGVGYVIGIATGIVGIALVIRMASHIAGPRPPSHTGEPGPPSGRSARPTNRTAEPAAKKAQPKPIEPINPGLLKSGIAVVAIRDLNGRRSANPRSSVVVNFPLGRAMTVLKTKGDQCKVRGVVATGWVAIDGLGSLGSVEPLDGDSP